MTAADVEAEIRRRFAAGTDEALPEQAEDATLMVWRALRATMGWGDDPSRPVDPERVDETEAALAYVLDAFRAARAAHPAPLRVVPPGEAP